MGVVKNVIIQLLSFVIVRKRYSPIMVAVQYVYRSITTIKYVRLPVSKRVGKKKVRDGRGDGSRVVVPRIGRRRRVHTYSGRSGHSPLSRLRPFTVMDSETFSTIAFPSGTFGCCAE